MPRTGRGGPRTGEPGVAYSNRTDLMEGGRGSMGTERPYGGPAVPDLPTPSAETQVPANAPTDMPAGGPPGPPPVLPGSFGPLNAKTGRPQESVLAGIDNPALNRPTDPDEVLRVMFVMSGGNEDLRELLEAR